MAAKALPVEKQVLKVIRDGLLQEVPACPLRDHDEPS